MCKQMFPQLKTEIKVGGETGSCDSDGTYNNIFLPGTTFIQSSSNKSRKNHESPEMNMKVFHKSLLFLLGE